MTGPANPFLHYEFFLSNIPGSSPDIPSGRNKNAPIPQRGNRGEFFEA
jgi:hypothetical protein